MLYEIGNLPQAVAEYYQVLERQPKLIDIWLKLGKILQIMGLEKEAIEVYEKALFLSENEGTQNHINGLIAVCQGESKNAISALNLAANLEPEKIVHWFALAQVHQRRENPLGVISALEQVLSINPNDVTALIYSYDALMSRGKISASREVLNRLIAVAEDDFRVRQRQIDWRCQMRLVSGKEGKKTKKMITAALGQTPHGAEAHKSLAYYHIFRRDWGQGVEVLAKFTGEHPHHPYGWYYYGRCLFEIGKYEKAGEIMQKAYLMYPDDCEIYRGLCELTKFYILYSYSKLTILDTGKLEILIPK
ncbi:lipopolysaccharide assembly protein LapB [Okeania sp. SIO3I5]|uniref:tetratricopeptide repeat protein n=1 Tax=Okeania sp. SIO3I5 TaxID=2607805 RepID=UPI0025ECD094|nr:tetratricopeptide repeat protein [Okeania sp. SIO3I5]